MNKVFSLALFCALSFASFAQSTYCGTSESYDGNVTYSLCIDNDGATLLGYRTNDNTLAAVEFNGVVADEDNTLYLLVDGDVKLVLDHMFGTSFTTIINGEVCYFKFDAE